MKIAIIGSNEQLTPPPENVIIASSYIASLIAEELAKRNHQVFSIVGKGSEINTNKVFSLSKPFFEVINKEDWEKIGDNRLMWQLIVPFEIDLHLTLLDFIKKNAIDLIHFHSIMPFHGLPFALHTKIPSLFTLHGKTSPIELQVIKTFLGKNIHFVSISNNQGKGYPGLDFAGTVYNGIKLENYTFDEFGGIDMVLAGRFKKDKGFEEAIQVAIKTKHRIMLAGDVRISQKDYFQKILMPLIGKNSQYVHFMNFLNHSMIDGFFKKGRLMLFPLQWEEPFGLVMIESMATGTPVVAFARGSVPEVIKDGETGFIVNPSDDDIRGNWIIKKTGIEGLCEAVERIYNMPNDQYVQMRKNCRAHVEKNFTVERMVDEYEKVYQKILSKK